MAAYMKGLDMGEKAETLTDLKSLPALIGTTTACKIAGVSLIHMLKICKEGKMFKAAKIGSIWRINTNDFLKSLGLDEYVTDDRPLSLKEVKGQRALADE